jgi:LuxR family maltose regulon positive regulatory protein
MTLPPTVETYVQSQYNAGSPEHLIRPRISALLAKAIENPLVIVCAGAGCGKTRAVSDFIREQNIPTLWMQFSERDNIGSRFWDTLTAATAQLDKALAGELRAIGFPDTLDKVVQCFSMICRSMSINQRSLHVLDDCHLLDDPAVLLNIERAIYELPKDTTLILICRDLPKINITSLYAEGVVPIIDEDDLNFTENELAQYMNQQGLPADRQRIREVSEDTHGWAFSVSLIARSLRKAPDYAGYVRHAMKQNLHQIMEKEVWGTASDRLQRFWTHLSLIDNLSVDLVTALAKKDTMLLTEFRRQNAYVRLDTYMGAYLIHHLFLNFLRTKQDILDDEESGETYKAAADWCRQNGFTMDALAYYEKVGDYAAIVSIFLEVTALLPHDVALYGLGIFERAPDEIFDRVEFAAVVHVLTIVSLARWQECIALIKQYERRFFALPPDNPARNRTLGALYYLLGCVRWPMSTSDDIYDFDEYFTKWGDLRGQDVDALLPFGVIQRGPWILTAGSSRRGAPQEYIEALVRSEKRPAVCFGGVTTGAADLGRGELLWYQGSIKAAEPFVIRALESASRSKQYDTMHRALLYALRIAVYQGSYAKAAKALKNLEVLVDEKAYSLRFTTYDIALGWFHYILRQPELFPAWLQRPFAPYAHAYFIENFGNQIKARYCYLTKNFQPLLKYIEELKQRESVLYGRIEMLTLEACARYQMKDHSSAFAALRESYETASPNDILMPFIELGKDMRTLAAAALSEPDCDIPTVWLETIKRRSSTYAKQQSLLIADYKRNNSLDSNRGLTTREKEILGAMYRGLSRSEIAEDLNRSINSVNSIINNIYKKLNAKSIADVVRIAAERKLV